MKGGMKPIWVGSGQHGSIEEPSLMGALLILKQVTGILHDRENESATKVLKNSVRGHLYRVSRPIYESIPWRMGTTHALRCHQFLVEQYREGLSDPRCTRTVTLPDFTIGKHLECPAGHQIHLESNGNTWPCDCDLPRYR